MPERRNRRRGTPSDTGYSAFDPPTTNSQQESFTAFEINAGIRLLSASASKQDMRMAR